ncbi:MAG: ASKHA domain-containing protein [Brevefilum sp.]
MSAYSVEFQPIGKRVLSDGSGSLLSLAREAGVSLSALCGGEGLCGACRVRCLNGDLTSMQPEEAGVFSASQLSQGWRLACLAFPRGDVSIEIPPESMTTSQRLQIDGKVRNFTLAPGVHLKAFSLPAPDRDDLRADWDRFAQLPTFDQLKHQSTPLPVVTQFSDLMRRVNWSGSAVFDDGGHILGFLPQGLDVYGAAFDIGTTKIAGFLVNLTTGETVAKSAAMNPQISYGEDVVSRITYANQGEHQRITLQTCLIEGINALVRELGENARVDLPQVVDYVVVANTAVHHLLTGLPVRQLGEAPYVAAVRQALRFPAREVGLIGAPGAHVYMPPNIAGYVGADHVAMLLASNIRGQRGVAVALDIGTNSEVSLVKGGRMVCCSCASGPAFEGAHIHGGMRAAPGAIERARFIDGEWHLATIDDQQPVGLCGSGILDVVASLLESGQIDSAGRFTAQAVRKINFPHGDAIVLVPAEKSGTGKDILVTRGDIREIQLAKAAIRAGVEALLNATATSADDIEQFLVAGAFGTYLNLDSALRIGMLPRLPLERFGQIGNAAGAGALEMLLSTASRAEAERIIEKMDYVELTTDPNFMASYVDAMGFDLDGK